MSRSMSAFEWTLLLSLSLVWGGSFFFVGVLVHELPPLLIAFLRASLAAVVFHAMLKVLSISFPRNRHVLFAMLIMGLLNNALPFALIVWAQSHIPSGLASILNATTPLFTVIGAHFLTTDEKITPGKLLGIVLGFCGVNVLFGPALESSMEVVLLAQVACLVAAISYAFAGIYGRKFKKLGVSPLVSATGLATASALILLPFVLLSGKTWAISVPSLQSLSALSGLVLLSTVAGYILYFEILSTAGATNLLLVTFLIPVSAIVLGWLILGERLEIHHFAGMAIISASLAAIDGRVLRLVPIPGKG